jgi:dolichol-phosphate mannosyltransferase
MEKISTEFSIVIPIYNEEENILDLYDRITAVMEKLSADLKLPHTCYELILVDDGSKDNSWLKIRSLHEKDPRVKGISFSRNFGHHIALSAGIDHALGNAVVLMDGDLQDPPEEIPRMYELFRKGYDLVYGIRQSRNDPIFKRVASGIFWWVLRKFSGVRIPPGQAMLRIMSRNLVNAMKEMGERSRFVHGMMAWAGFRTTTLEIRHSQRRKGTSKYNIPKMFKLAFHAITSFSTVPLRLAIYIGLLSSTISFVIGIFFIFRKIFSGIPVMGYASIIVSIFFMGGVQLLIFGMFGEYLGRIYQEVQQRPLYIIKETLLRK